MPRWQQCFALKLITARSLTATPLSKKKKTYTMMNTNGKRQKYGKQNGTERVLVPVPPGGPHTIRPRRQ